MIVPMKKVYILLATYSLDNDLKDLQALGLVDTSMGTVDSDNPVLQKHTALSTALENIDTFKDESSVFSSNIESFHDVYERARHINTVVQNIEDVEKNIDTLKSQLIISKRFSGVSVKTVQELEKKHIYLSAYKAPATAKNPAHTADTAHATTGYTHTYCLWKDKEQSYWAVFSFEDGTLVPPDSWVLLQFPHYSSTEIEQQIAQAQKTLDSLKKELDEQGSFYQSLLIAHTNVSNELARVSVSHGAYTTGDVTIIEGYAPKDAITKILSYAAEKQWGIVVDDVDENDENVPTEIKNVAPVRIIKPLFDFLDVDAGYREFDISFIFLAFMSLFVGMIIGDAGYGFVLLIFSVWATIASQVKQKEITLAHMLFIWFSCTTIVWGAITGNWFGYAPLAENPLLSQFIIPQFSILSEDSSTAIQLFAFRVGIVHLVLAHVWRAIRVIRIEGILATVNQLAQATLLIGLFFLVLQLLLGTEKFAMPPYTIQLIAIGFICIILTEEQKRGQNIFVGAGKGIANIITLALNSISSFADIISYIRLYAVGLASFSIATSFNAMGEGFMQSGGIGAIIGGIAIVVLGHTLNLVMAVLAVIVHGVRLNVLEFSGHLGMEWSGRKYNPFKKKIITRRI